MKNIINIIAFCCVVLFGSAICLAQKDDAIEINPYLGASVEDVPVEAQQILLNKLGEVLTQNGVIKGQNSNFIITANTVVSSEVITTTAPPMHVYDLMLTLYIGNSVDGKLFATHTTTLKGVGTTKQKSYIDAFKGFNVKNDKEIAAFISKSKSKIVDYYNTKCSTILSEASMLEKTDRYSESVYLLTSVPQSSSCYPKAIAATQAIYKKAIDFDCKTKTLQASQVWNASPTAEGAMEAANILKTINPRSSCYNDVKILGAKISKKMTENDAREWNLFYLQEAGLEKDRIEAMKEVGKAYGLGQPRIINFNTRPWF